jgi:hypothetical protein
MFTGFPPKRTGITLGTKPLHAPPDVPLGDGGSLEVMGTLQQQPRCSLAPAGPRIPARGLGRGGARPAVDLPVTVAPLRLP